MYYILSNVTVATITFDDESYYVVEREELVQVNATRSGNLQNTSIVLVATDNFRGSASGGQELTLKDRYVIYLSCS